MIRIWNKILLFVLSIIPATLFAQYESVQNNDSITGKYERLIEVGYLQQQPAYITNSSISSVSGEVLEKTLSSNLHNALLGRLPGLTITQGSNEPGVVNNTLRSRGIASYTGSNDILLLVDGFRSSFSELVPEEIESITLLKDAAATAIYGLRGANGVLLVTTKRGVKQPLKVSFSAQVGFQQATRTPEYLNSYDYARLYNEGSVNDGTGIVYSDDALEKYRTNSSPYLYPNVNWYDELTRSVAPTYNLDLNFRGGDDVVRYFVLLNMVESEGLLKRSGSMSDMSINTSYVRYNIRSNVDWNVTRRFSAAATVGVSIADRKTPHTEYVSGLYDNVSAMPPNVFPIYNPNGTWGGNSNFTNPVGNLLETGFYTSNSRTINASLKLTEQLDMITEGLSISGAVAFNNWYLGNSNKTKDYARYQIVGYDDNGEYSYGDRLGEDTSLESNEGGSTSWRNTNILASLDYNRVFGLHGFDAKILYQYESHYEGATDPYKHIGAGGKLTYVYDKKYIAEFSAGYQGTEIFAIGKQYGFFPAGSLGWVISNEEFMGENQLFDYLKIRASYGLTGNDGIGGSNRYMYNDEYSNVGGYPLGTASTTVWGNGLSVYGNPDVTWEKEKKLNIGIDATLLKSLDFSFDYFNDKREDILTTPNRNIPAYFGTLLPMLNIGETKRSGFEATLKYSNDFGKDFNYFVQLSGWYSKNEIVYNSESVKTEEYQYATGRQIFQPYYYIADGFYTQADLDNADVAKPSWMAEGSLKPGDIKYVDKNNDGVIDGNDSYPTGTTDLPGFTVGLTLGFEYKGFDFSAFLHGVGDRDVYLGSNYYRAFQNNGTVTEVALGRWTPETANTATYPRLSVENNQNNFVGSTFWLEDGSFIKLRSVELGYTFKNIDQLKNADIRLFVQGNNLFSIDHIKDSDPELMSGYPAVRTISLGAKMQF